MANYTLTDLLLFSAGAILVSLYYIGVYIYEEVGLCEFGRWRQPLPWPFFFDGAKEPMTQKAPVNGSYNHGLAFASHSFCLPEHACTIEILLIKCWWHVMCATAINTR